MDIENQNFDSKRYVLNMLKENTIKQLIRRNNEIDQEIKVHDHEIQSLVFENYSKFISSIDTVREMKDNICMVDDKLKILDKSMNRISELALKIDSTFSVKRKEIQKLDTINKDLEKLKNLCEFPNILKQDISYYRSLPDHKLGSEAENLFKKSIISYEGCYKTLVELRDQPLIAPIYKESLDKVETMRSTLKALQVQFNKNKLHSHILRNITNKLLVITDDQVSILRIYLHSWKERFGQACFKSEKKATLGLTVSENGKKIMNQLINSEIPEINEELWKQFQIEFSFIYGEIYPKLTLSAEEIQLHISSYAKEIFGWALNHYVEAAPSYCTSLKSYVHVNHVISSAIRNSLAKMKAAFKDDSKQTIKIYNELKAKMDEKFESLGISMLNFVFGRLKLYFIVEILEGKENCGAISISEETLKESYIKILNPIKENVTSNFKLILDDMEHFRHSYEIIFKSQEKYQQVIHKQIQNLIKFLAIVTSKTADLFSDQLCLLINPNFNQKLIKSQKALIENYLRRLTEVNQSGCWYVVANNYLNSLVNHLGKKIIESTQKSVQIPKNHNYANVFTFGKMCLSKNLISMADYFAFQISSVFKFEQMIEHIQDFVDVLNLIFPDSKRSIMRKPSFLSELNVNVHETEILTVKKFHLIDRKNPSERNSILTYFIRKLLKELLVNIRSVNYTRNENAYTEHQIYSLIQICYELSNVEEQGQISSFYHLIRQNWTKNWTFNREESDEKYSQVRKLSRALSGSK